MTDYAHRLAALPPVRGGLVGGFLAAVVAAFLLFAAGEREWAGSPGTGEAKGVSEAQAERAYGKLPLRFEPNRGQSDRRVKFVSRGAGYSLFLTQREAVLSLTRTEAPSPGSPAGRRGETATVRMRPVGANPNARMSAGERLAGHTNYLTGKEAAGHQTRLPGYGRVRYEGIYPGIDLVYRGAQRKLEYDFVLAPGADPGRIALAIGGSRRLSIDRGGDLIIDTAAGKLRQQRPYVFQRVGGAKRRVQGRYVLQGGDRVGFSLGAYDRSRPLVIDPVLAYSTYLGGSGYDTGAGIAVDSSGSAYVTGYTGSNDFPTAGAAQPAGSNDAFVTKLKPDGSGLVYSTYLGGSNSDEASGIAVDSSGSAYVTGYTGSNDFPTAGAAQPAAAGSYDAFVTKLKPDGSGLVYSTYLGGSNYDTASGIAVDPSGAAHVAGRTYSTDFPLEKAFQPANGGSGDAFVTKLNPAGAALEYSSYLGGDNYDEANGIGLDPAGAAYVVGRTYSSSTDAVKFPTKSAFQGASGGSADAFVTKVNPDGSGLGYSTYLGGSSDEEGRGIAVDSSGGAWVAGRTDSPNFPIPTSANSFQRALGGSGDAFVTKLNPDGGALGYSSYLGGDNYDIGKAIAVDGSGDAYVSGQTWSTAGFPSKDSVQADKGENADAFVARFNGAATGPDSLVYSTYLGGSSDEEGRGIAVDASGAYVTGYTASADFFTRNPAAQGELRGSGTYDAFAAKIATAPSPEPAVSGVRPRSGPTSGGTKVEISGQSFTGATAVHFGDTPAASFTVDSDKQITAVTPMHRKGEVRVTVTNPAGTSPLPGVARFAFTEGAWARTGAPPSPGVLGGPAVRLKNGKVLVVGSQFNLSDQAQLYDPATDSWSTTGNLNTERAGHTVTALPDGRALVAGGSGADIVLGGRLDGNPIASVELFDPAAAGGTGAFTTAVTGLTVPRSNHTATLLNGPPEVCGSRCGMVLVTGGYNERNVSADTAGGSNTAEVYDPATGVSVATGNLLTPYVDHRAVQLSREPVGSERCGANCGRVLVEGGPKLAAAGNADPELYSPLTNSWTRTLASTAIEPRYQTLTLLRSGKVLAAGGHPTSINNSPTSRAELYNPAALQTETDLAWRLTGSMQDARANHAAARLPSGGVLVVGGGGRPEIYDPAPESWRPTFGDRYFPTTATLLSSPGSADPDDFRADPAVCGDWCGKVLVQGGPEPLLYTPAPTITAISRDSGPAEGGSAVTLTGTGFTNSTRLVRFGGEAVDCPSARCKVDSFDKLTVTTPAHAPGLVDVTVINGGGLNVGPPTRFTYTAASATAGEGSGIAVTTPGTGGPQQGGVPSGDLGGLALASERRRARAFRGCLVRAARHTRLDLAATRRGSLRARASARRHLRRHRAAMGRRCVARYGRTPGRVTGLAARGLPRKVVLSFLAPGSDRNRPPPARGYLVKQSLRPITDAHSFRRAQTLCNGTCRFPARHVRESATLTVTELRPKTTYYYAIAARDNVSRRLGPRSGTVKARTR